MWKKRVTSYACSFCVIISLFFCGGHSFAESAGTQQAKAIAVIDLESGRLLLDKDADKKLPMASTTKIMTAMLVLENGYLDEPFVVDETAIRVEGSSMGLQVGDTVTLRTLVYGMLLPSGNDAANAAAVHIAGSRENFVRMMNDRAAELGLVNTHFVTPSGLDSEGHYSTAEEMALLAREALSNQEFAEICSKSSAKVNFGAPPSGRWLKNHNKLLKYRADVIGVKTGFTKVAGRCLVSAANREDIGFVIVTLGCPDDWNVHTQLYDKYFQNTIRKKLELPQVTVPVAGFGELDVEWTQNDVILVDGEVPNVSLFVNKMIYAPVKKGQVVGSAEVMVDGKVIEQIALVSKEAVPIPVEKRSVWSHWFR